MDCRGRLEVVLPRTVLVHVAECFQSPLGFDCVGGIDAQCVFVYFGGPRHRFELRGILELEAQFVDLFVSGCEHEGSVGLDIRKGSCRTAVPAWGRKVPPPP